MSHVASFDLADDGTLYVLRTNHEFVRAATNTWSRVARAVTLLYDRWHKGKALRGDESERQAEREQALAYIRRDPTLPGPSSPVLPEK